MKNNKRKLGILLVVVIAIASNLIRTNAFQNIRTVDLVQILACGIIIGVLIGKMIAWKKETSTDN